MSDHPVRSCLGSQYAGWALSTENYFAMGSGAMRATAGVEAIIGELGLKGTEAIAIGVLESAALPPDEIVGKIADACGVECGQVTLLVARTSSLCGTVQVVARSLETALHKLHELDFDMSRVVSGCGLAPLPPIAANDLAAIGWTNDAILYGGQVTLWVTGDDASLQEIGPQTPSAASRDFGEPFADTFERYDRDFYKIDKMLFSPAQITFINVDTGSLFRFGGCHPETLLRSFRITQPS